MRKSSVLTLQVQYDDLTAVALNLSNTLSDAFKLKPLRYRMRSSVSARWLQYTWDDGTNGDLQSRILIEGTGVGCQKYKKISPFGVMESESHCSMGTRDLFCGEIKDLQP